MNIKLISLLVFFLWNASFHITPSFLAAGQTFEQLSPEGGINRIIVSESRTGVAVDPITNKIYVANSDDETVSVIYGKTNNVIKTIILEDQSPTKIAIKPGAEKIYVTDKEYDTVSVIDGKQIIYLI
jgi:YVTN family beta-propeller protein